MYFWKLSNGTDRKRFELRPTFTSPCEFQIRIDNLFPNFSFNRLNNLLRSTFKLHCEIDLWYLYLGDVRDVSPIYSYTGSPTKVSTKEYLKGDTRERLRHELILASTLLEVFPNTNISTVPKTKIMRKKNNTWRHQYVTHLRINPFSKFSKDVLSDDYWYPTETSGYRFMSCDERLTFLSFRLYASPFDLNSWISIGITLSISTLFLACLFFLKGIEENGILLLYSFLLENGYHLGSRLQRLRPFNIFLSIFLFTGIVLTNEYKGVVILPCHRS